MSEAEALKRLVEALAALAQALDKMAGPKRAVYENGRVIRLV